MDNEVTLEYNYGDLNRGQKYTVRDILEYVDELYDEVVELREKENNNE